MHSKTLLLVNVCLGLWAGFIFTSAATSYAQGRISVVSLNGTVFDETTEIPLLDAHVFMANSLLEATTNQEGRFNINGISFGSYTLVVTAEGYEPHIQNILLARDENESFPIYLTPRSITPGREEKKPEATESSEERQRNLNTFRQFFLGISPHAGKCEIINPEVLHFENNETNQTFTAQAEEVLIIHNKALGYKMSILLEDFAVSFASNNKSIQYTIFVGFSELTPDSKREVRRWRRARRDAYRGSERHFLSALVADDLINQGYLLVEEGAIQAQQPSGIPGARPTDRIPTVKTEDILRPGSYPFERVLDFDGYLKVVNQNDAPENEYWDFKEYAADWEVPDADPLYQVSWISLTNGPVTITSNGLVMSKYGLTKLGYWFFDRVAEMLPVEYRL